MIELSRDELRLLIESGKTPCLSIYLPTSKAGAEVQQNPIRLKNLIKQAEDQLTADGRRSAEVERFLEPVQSLTRNNPFWRQQSTGLAIFLCPDFFRAYRLPREFETAVTVGERFYIKPLLPLYNLEGQFYVLAVSQKNVRLIECSRYAAREVPLEGVPKNIDETLKYDVWEKQQVRPKPARGGTLSKATNYWSGYTKDHVLRFLQQVDKGLKRALKDDKAPMVFAGVEYVFSIFNEVNSYPSLVETALNGNAERMSPEELHREAWPLIEPVLKREQEDAKSRYRQSIGTGLASNNIEEIVPAANDGRIGYLFVETGREKWGTFDPQTGRAVQHEKREPHALDLIEFSSIGTLIGAGKVYSVDRAGMPDQEPVAALFRY